VSARRQHDGPARGQPVGEGAEDGGEQHEAGHHDAGPDARAQDAEAVDLTEVRRHPREHGELGEHAHEGHADEQEPEVALPGQIRDGAPAGPRHRRDGREREGHDQPENDGRHREREEGRRESDHREERGETQESHDLPGPDPCLGEAHGPAPESGRGRRERVRDGRRVAAPARHTHQEPGQGGDRIRL